MVIDGALFLGKYVKGNPALEARDVREAANRVVGTVNAALFYGEEDCRPGIFVDDFNKHDFNYHPFISSVQLFKNGKCRLTFRKAEYAAKVTEAAQKQRKTLAA
jgi:hypothetical protein